MPRLNTTDFVGVVHCGLNSTAMAALLASSQGALVSRIVAHAEVFSFSGIELRCDDSLSAELRIPFARFLKILKKELENGNANSCSRTLSVRSGLLLWTCQDPIMEEGPHRNVRRRHPQ